MCKITKTQKCKKQNKKNKPTNQTKTLNRLCKELLLECESLCLISAGGALQVTNW